MSISSTVTAGIDVAMSRSRASSEEKYMPHNNSNARMKDKSDSEDGLTAEKKGHEEDEVRIIGTVERSIEENVCGTCSEEARRYKRKYVERTDEYHEVRKMYKDERSTRRYLEHLEQQTREEVDYYKARINDLKRELIDITM